MGNDLRGRQNGSSEGRVRVRGEHHPITEGSGGTARAVHTVFRLHPGDDNLANPRKLELLMQGRVLESTTVLLIEDWLALTRSDQGVQLPSGGLTLQDLTGSPIVPNVKNGNIARACPAQ
jgi:hypothetical protein